MHINGFYNFIGFAIKLAIKDYRKVENDEHFQSALKKLEKSRNLSKRKRDILSRLREESRNYDSAKYWIFDKRGLERLLKLSGINEYIDIEFIRKQAKLTKEESKWAQSSRQCSSES